MASRSVPGKGEPVRLFVVGNGRDYGENLLGDYDETVVCGDMAAEDYAADCAWPVVVKVKPWMTVEEFVHRLRDLADRVEEYGWLSGVKPYAAAQRTDYFCCPQCGGKGLHLAANPDPKANWFVCDRCRVRWCEGIGLFSGWEDMTEEELEANAQKMEGYAEFDPRVLAADQQQPRAN